VSTYPNELALLSCMQNKWDSLVFCSYSGDQDKYQGGARAIGLDVPANERFPFLSPPHPLDFYMLLLSMHRYEQCFILP